MGSVEGSERLGLPEARRIVAPRAARCTKFGNLVGLVLSWRTVFALLVLRATCGCCTRAHHRARLSSCCRHPGLTWIRAAPALPP